MQVPGIAIIAPNYRGEGPVELIPDDDEEGDAGAKAVDGDDHRGSPPAPHTGYRTHYLQN